MDASSSSRFYTFEWELTFPVADVMLDNDVSDEDAFASAKSRGMAKVVACEVIDGLLGPGSCKDFVINSSFQGFDDDVARTANAYHLLEITGPVDTALILERELLGDNVAQGAAADKKFSADVLSDAIAKLTSVNSMRDLAEFEDQHSGQSGSEWLKEAKREGYSVADIAMRGCYLGNETVNATYSCNCQFGDESKDGPAYLNVWWNGSKFYQEILQY